MKKYKALIKNIDTNEWLVDEKDGVIVCTEKKKDATIFYDEDDAEATIEFVNDTSPDCFTLIKL